MISYETILSSYDDKMTLLEWLKKVEEALADASLSSVEVIQSASNKAKFKFIFADGTYLLSPQLTLPLGPVGPQGPIGERGEAGRDGEDGKDGVDGANGVSVTNVSVDASNHLIVTLSNGTSIDAGEINVPTITIDNELSASSENPVQNKVIYSALGGKQDTLTFDSTPIQDSNNPVKSGGVYSALSGKQANLTTSSVEDGTIDKSIGFDSLGNLVKGSGGGTQPTGQVTTTFTLPQDVQDMLTVPHGIVIFSKNATITLPSEFYTVCDIVGNSVSYSGNYLSSISDTSSDISTTIGIHAYKLKPTTISGLTYYGSISSDYAILANATGTTKAPSITVTANIIKLVNGNLTTSTITFGPTSINLSKWGLGTIKLQKTSSDIILLIEITSLVVS